MSGRTVHILLLEDSDLDAELVERQLRRARLDMALTRAVDRGGFVQALEAGGHDIILCDFSLPDIDGAAALELAQEKAPQTPFIFVSGVLGEEVAIESLRDGATDYVLKQRLERLPSAVTRALNEARERMERRRAEEHMNLLVAELSHRVKNTMATVIAMARLTLRQSKDLGSFEAAFMSRLQALAEAHSLVFQANWGETDLRQVVERAIAPFIRREEGRASVEGEAVKLSPKFALALTLMLHELATNAAKYGALKGDAGRVAVGWRVAPGDPDMIHLRWVESGGPPVLPPSRKGFGHSLIERGARYELEGEAELLFPETGVTAELTFPTGRAGAE